MRPLAGAIGPLGSRRAPAVVVESFWGLTYTGATAGPTTTYNNGLGSWFDVTSPVTITDIGMYRPGGHGSDLSGWLGGRARLASTSAPSTLLVDEALTNASLYDAATGILYVTLAAPVVLSPGTYSVWSYGYGQNNMGYHRLTSEGAAVALDTLGGKVTWDTRAAYSNSFAMPGDPPGNGGFESLPLNYKMGTFKGF